MFFKKKMKNYSTALIMFIYIITILLPCKLVLAAEITAPVMTLVGDDTVYVATGSIYEDQGVDIKDDKDTNLSATVTVTDVTNGPVTVVTTGAAVTYEKGAYLVFNKEGIYKLQYNVTDSDKNVAAYVTRTVEVNTMDDDYIDAHYYIDRYKIDLSFKLLSDSEIENLLVGAITTPAAVQVTRNDDILTAKLMKEDGKEFTTTAAITYEWYRNEQLVKDGTEDTYTISNDDKGNRIVAKVDQYHLESDSYYIDEPGIDEPGVTTPAAVSVRIKGTEKVGNTLTGEFILEDGSQFTTSSAVTYEWYRLANKNSENSTLVGENKTYRLVSSDGSKYMKLLVYYEDETFEAITSKIAKKSSSSSSSSSSNNQTTETNNQTTVENNNNSTASAGSSQNSTSNADPTVLAEGWNGNSTEWKYIKNGQPVIRWNQIGGNWYLMNPIGIMQTGWQQMDSTWYFLKSDGAMVTGWQQINGTWYFLKSDGAMAIGWQQVNGIWYFLKSDGAMATGWQQIDSTWYFLNNNGALAE